MSGILAAIPGMFSAAAPVALEAGEAIGASAAPVAAESLYSTAAPIAESFLTSGPESLVGYPTTASAVPAASSGGLGSFLNYAGPISQVAGLFNWTPPPYTAPQFGAVTPEMFGRRSARNLYDSMVAPPSYGISPLEQESVYGHQKA